MNPPAFAEASAGKPARTPFAPLPKGKFGVIYADPNWLFETYSAAGEGKSPQRHYRCLPDSDLHSLPVASVAAENCALFLWVTWPKIESALRLIREWGFVYSGLAFDWVKFNPVTEKFAFGGGYGTRKNPEPCLLARRGWPERRSRSERDLIFAPRREHSRKPDEAYERMERLYAGPYLELFARARRPGWEAWGNEVGKFG
jgi:N6-adenosine-specific RNA methylase IME4